MDLRMRPLQHIRRFSKKKRQHAIRKVLRDHRVATQQELAERLRAEGIEATQATLSRDLAELGMLRV